MKSLLFITILIFFGSCGPKSTDSASIVEYGQKIDTSNSLSVSEFVHFMNGKTFENCIVKGKIADICQSEGCWLNLENTSGSNLFVKMKDHAFTLPMDIAGRTIIVKGIARMDTTSVDILKDYAADARKSEADIEAITEPEIELIVEADGVVLLSNQDAGKK